MSTWIVLFHNKNFRNILVNILNNFVTLSFVSDKLSHQKSKIKRFSKKSWENSRHFATPPLVFPRNSGGVAKCWLVMGWRRMTFNFRLFSQAKNRLYFKTVLRLYKTHNGWLLVYSLYILFKHGYNRSFSGKFCLISIKERVSCFSSGKRESPLVPGKGVDGAARSSILLGDWECAVPPWERGFEIGCLSETVDWPISFPLQNIP